MCGINPDNKSRRNSRKQNKKNNRERRGRNKIIVNENELNAIAAVIWNLSNCGGAGRWKVGVGVEGCQSQPQVFTHIYAHQLGNA